MPLLNCLSNQNIWIQYFEYKVQYGHLCENEAQDLFRFIHNQEYIGILNKIAAEGLSTPCKKQIQKIDSTKKRIVYTFPKEENYILKLLTYLLIRMYDGVFSPNLYSFRANYSIKQAFQHILSTSKIDQYYTIK